MMSGSNPFRRRKPSDEPAASQARLDHNHYEDDVLRAVNRFPPLTVETAPPRASPKPKTVRIASPPVPISPETPLISPTPDSSPILPRRPASSGSSPSPAESDSESSGGTSPIDPFNADTSDVDDDRQDEEVLVNTRRNLKISDNPTVKKQEQAPIQDKVGEPRDPVQSTLAKFASGPRRGLDGSTKKASHLGKPSMDVDAFKRLLLTGNSSLPAPSNIPASPSQGPQGQHGGISDSSSNTDTASVSRQSIFEPLHAVPSDTPRTSHEISMSDDERQRLVIEPSEGKKKPPPPKARHGKLIKSNPSSPANISTTTVTGSSDYPSSQSLPILPPVTSDLNKPLPPPPAEPDPFIPRAVFREEPESMSSEPSTTTRQRPPTPPLTRRMSQMKTSRPNPRLSLDPSLLKSPTSPNQSPLKTPPAPPSRRSYSSHSLNSSSPASTISPSFDFPAENTQSSTQDGSRYPTAAITSPTPTTPTATTPIVVQKSSAPPPPPTRTVSSASIKRLSRPPSHTRDPSTASLAMAPPPPPPPRRGRGASANSSSFDPPSRGSLDTRRPSQDSSRKVSGSSMAISDSESIDENKGNAADIMADLNRLQKELDDYRGKVEGPAAKP